MFLQQMILQSPLFHEDLHLLLTQFSESSMTFFSRSSLVYVRQVLMFSCLLEALSTLNNQIKHTLDVYTTQTKMKQTFQSCLTRIQQQNTMYNKLFAIIQYMLLMIYLGFQVTMDTSKYPLLHATSRLVSQRIRECKDFMTHVATTIVTHDHCFCPYTNFFHPLFRMFDSWDKYCVTRDKYLQKLRISFETRKMHIEWQLSNNIDPPLVFADAFEQYQLSTAEDSSSTPPIHSSPLYIFSFLQTHYSEWDTHTQKVLLRVLPMPLETPTPL
jgi:hypothetical protein